MTETKRIRWEPTRYGGWTGHVATLDPWVFQIFRSVCDEGAWKLMAQLPGELGNARAGDDLDELKAEAERWLTGFVVSLGAVFPDEAYEFPDDGKLLEVKFAAGTRVRFAHPDAGYPGEAEEAMKALTPGRVYTIAWADIGQSRTDLNLAAKGKSLGRFNSVLFEPVDDEAAPMAAPTRED